MFELSITSVFTVGGRGTVLAGRLSKCRVQVGDRAVLRTPTREVLCRIDAVEVARVIRAYADPADDVGVLCRDIQLEHLADCTELDGEEQRVTGATLVSAPRRWWELWRDA